MVLVFLFSLLGCGEGTNRYQCSCEVTAYEMEDQNDVEERFSEIICETEETMNTVFEENGSMFDAKAACEAEYEDISEDYSCDCTCVYLEQC